MPDALAATHAHNEIRNFLYRNGTQQHCPTDVADELLRHFTPVFERKDGLRRIVLEGSWEVDPAAMKAA